MKISFFPKSKLGVWSIILFLLLVLLVTFFFLMVNVFNQRGGDTFFSNLTLTIPMLAAWAAGLISFVFALTATVKSKHKSVLVCIVGCVTFLTTVYGIFAVL
jgi:hypothetical protein